jgi:uncharacterized lipoprotein YajG
MVVNYTRRILLGLTALGLLGCGGTSGSSLFLSTPVISAISPNPVARGATITISGSELNGTQTTATFSGAKSAVSAASSGNSTSVIVSVPTTLDAGTYNVTVTTTDSLGDSFGPSNTVTIQLT